MLQFITNTDCNVPVRDQIFGVLEGGCQWIQIRMKDASDDEIRSVYAEIKSKCAEKEAFIVINDRVELAKELEASGVHLGKTDMLPSKARLMLGPSAIIGVTANTTDDVIAVRSLDIDYIGIGPYTMTHTKKNLSPVLGCDGIKSVCSAMKDQQIDIARVAVGGIKLDDVKSLMKTGINGIAVSGAIACAGNIPAMTEKFIRELNHNKNE